MSRSRQEQVTHTGSAKWWKQQYNRAMRRKPVSEDVPLKEEVSDIWESPKEHRGWSNDPKDRRK